MAKYFQFFFVKAVGNESLTVGPNYRVLEEEEEKEEIIEIAHKAMTEEGIDVSRILKNEMFGDPYFYINNRLTDALEILQEIDEDY